MTAKAKGGSRGGTRPPGALDTRPAPFAPSCLIVRKADGKLDVINLDESADPALEMRDRLRRCKGRNDRGALVVSDVLPIIRGKPARQLHFA